MEDLANTLERLALEDTTDEFFIETIKHEYQYLLDLANDVDLAALDTHLAGLYYSGLGAQISGTTHGACRI